MGNKITLKVGVLVVFRGKLLLIKEKSSYDNQYHWNIIKGTYEPGSDRSLIETAEREAKEEAGATIKTLQLFNVFEVEKNKKTIIQVNFLANSKNKSRLTDQHQQKKRDEDIIEIKLFNRETLRKMKRKDFINERAYITVRNWITDRKGLFKPLF